MKTLLARRIVGICCLGMELIVLTYARGATITIDQDTAIDSTNSFPGDHVQVVNGLSQTTHVTMLPGGTVAGFTVTNNSTLEMTGGIAIAQSSTRDNATLTMRGGRIECSAPTCLVIDLISLLSVNDNSSIHVFGGVIFGPISLQGNGTAHFYGKNLTLSVGPGGAHVEGVLASGDAIGEFGIISLDPLLNLSAHIFLHEVPEPGTAILTAVVVSMILLHSRNSLA